MKCLLPDHSPPRFQEDVDAFVDSIGGSVFLVGWSDGAADLRLRIDPTHGLTARRFARRR